MTILVVSDLHYNKSNRGFHHGVFEGAALEWLFKIIDLHKPKELIICGDSDEGWNPQEWDELADKIHVSAVYGNHENLPILSSAKNADGSKVLMRDGERRDIEGLKFGFINGIMSPIPNKVKKGIPRKTPEDFWRYANALKGVDALVTHESPDDDQYGNRIRRGGIGCLTMKDILDKNQYPMALSGHLAGPYTIARIGCTISIRVDSSPSEKVYALILPRNPNSVYVQIYQEYDEAEKLSVPLP